MPSLAELRKQKLKEQEETKKESEVKKVPKSVFTPEKIPGGKKPKLKIKTDRDANKKHLLNRITNTLEGEIENIPIEVFRSFDLFFRTIKERGK